MSFLGMGPFEIIIILLVAFIFLGPERMADAARTLGKWTSELRRATAGVRAEMDDLITDDPTPSAQTPPPRPTQTRPTNADAASDAIPDDAPVAFRRAPANPPPNPPSDADAAPTPNAAPPTDKRQPTHPENNP